MKTKQFALLAVIVLALLSMAAIPAFQHTGFNGIYLTGSGLGTATPVLLVNSRGIPAQFKINNTPVAQINSGLDMTGPANFDGAVDFDSTVDFSGATVTGVSTSTLSSLTVTGAAALNGGITADTSAFTVADTTGNTVISGTLSVSDAVDINAAADISGNITDSDSAVTFADNVLVDGAADAAQLTVQGYTTQTNNLLVLEQSDGTDKLTASNDGNLYVAGTSDLRGNVSDGGGAFTVADNAAITGQADAVQLTVTGYTTQTNSILVVEDSNGDDRLSVDNTGGVIIAGNAGTDLTNVLTGSVKIGDGTPDVAQDGEDLYVESQLEVDGATRLDGTTTINGNMDADSISVAGNSDLTTINNSGGDLSITDNLDITGTLQYGADDLYPLGYATPAQQMVCGTTEMTGSAEIEATGLTTITYVLAPHQVTAITSTAVYLYASDPTTNTFVLTSLDSTYTAATVPISAHWCAVGDQ
jgi:cytoskeletal protein CcmA (bactofilin family)